MTYPVAGAELPIGSNSSIRLSCVFSFSLNSIKSDIDLSFSKNKVPSKGPKTHFNGKQNPLRIFYKIELLNFTFEQ